VGVWENGWRLGDQESCRADGHGQEQKDSAVGVCPVKGEQSREMQRRITDKLLGVLEVLAPVVLTKYQWIEAIDAAE
jgi:hypothetical protein